MYNKISDLYISGAMIFEKNFYHLTDDVWFTDSGGISESLLYETRNGLFIWLSKTVGGGRRNPTKKTF
jgi:hypothetical protein